MTAPEEKQEIVKICPNIESFLDVQSNIKCPINNCDKILANLGPLRWHLSKTHGIPEAKCQKAEAEKVKTDNCYVEYHCPITSCIYNVNSERHFSKISLLRQHYRKVHAEKKYKCEKCGNGFGMDKDRRRHEDKCGVIYKCGTCQCPYTTVEAVMTHCTRKQHQLPEEVVNAAKNRQRKKIEKEQTSNHKGAQINSINPSVSVIMLNVHCTPVVDTTIPKPPQYKPIYPKPVPVNVKFIASKPQITPKPKALKVSSKENSEIRDRNINPLSKSLEIEETCLNNSLSSKTNETVSQGIQTNVNILPRTNANVCSMGIQTAVTIPLHKKKMRTATHTQTSAGDLILQTAMATASIPIKKMSIGTQITPRSKVKRRKSVCSSETQTFDVVPSKRRRRRRLSGQRTPPRMDSTSQTTENQTFTVPSSSLPPRVDSTCQTVGDQRAQYGIFNDSTCQTGLTDMTSTCVQTNLMIDGISQTHSLQNLQKNAHGDSSRTKHSCIDRNIIPPVIEVFQNYQVKERHQLPTTTLDHSFASISGGVPTSPVKLTNNEEANNTTSSRIICGLVTTIENDDYLGKILSARQISDTDNVQSTNSVPSISASAGRTGNETLHVRGDSLFNYASHEQTWIDESVGQETNNISMDSQASKKSYAGSVSVPHNDLNPCQTQGFISQTTEGNISKASGSEGSLSSVGLSPLSISHTESLSKETQSCSTSTDTLCSIFNNQRFASFADSQVQTLSSASDIDFLLHSELGDTTGNIASMDMHTQTVNDVDVLDFLVNDIETQTMDTQTPDFSLINMETQTGQMEPLSVDEYSFNLQSDHPKPQTSQHLSFGNIETQNVQTMETQTSRDFGLHDFSLTNTGMQTQSVFGLDQPSDYQTTTATQTSQDVRVNNQPDLQLSAGTQCATDLADMQTQTPFPGFFSFPMTNTYTQTIEDLDNIFADFDG